MFVMDSLFWIIVSLGIALPPTFTIFLNLIIKVRAGDNYELNLLALFKIYVIALIGWAIAISEVFHK